MRLFLARHGQSVGNLTGDFSTRAHDNLTDLGRTQAAALARHLEPVTWGRLYCSPLVRALQTAQPLAEALKEPVEVWPELAESCWQEDRTLRSEPTVVLVPMAWPEGVSPELFQFRDGIALEPPHDETYSQGLHRVRRAAELLVSRHGDSDQPVLVVSHGFTLGRMIEILLGIEPVGRFDHGNTGLSLLVGPPGRLMARFLNRPTGAWTPEP